MGLHGPFADERHLAFCAQCGSTPDTRDHVPPKAFLDRPFPVNLPVVGTCKRCNEGASSDEEFVACLLEVVACGSADLERLERPRVVRALKRRPSLAAKVRDAYDPTTGTVVDGLDRIQRVIEKTARGLWAYELAEPALGMSAYVALHPLHTMVTAARASFEHIQASQVLAEVGSRMMIRQLAHTGAGISGAGAGWQSVQPNRFRYAVQFDGGDTIKIVIRECWTAKVLFGQS